MFSDDTIEDLSAKLIGGPDAVLMKAVTLPGTTVIAACLMTGFVECGDARLGGDRFHGENRVLVIEPVDDVFLGDAFGRVDGDEVINVL